MLTQATIIGRQHRLMNQNAQDFALVGSPQPGYFYGLVLDGCGSKYRETADTQYSPKFQTYPSQNEVGAKIIGQFIGQWLERHLTRQESICHLPDKLQLATERFLQGTVNNMGYTKQTEITRFIRTNLLATILGFVITPSQGCFFWIGDGYLIFNREVSHLDCNNQPPYLAYNMLCHFSGKGTEMQSRFFSITDDLVYLAVATDGWQGEQLTELEPSHSPLQLQRWVNVQARQRGRFEDDGAIAMWVNDDH